MRNKVVDDYAVDLHGLSGKFRRREFRCPRCGDGRGLQQRMTRHACAEITLPFSSISTCTCTEPAACALRAIAGYGGVTRWTALPLRTPPEIGACGVGFGVGAGGGGSSLVSTRVGAEMN